MDILILFSAKWLFNNIVRSSVLIFFPPKMISLDDSRGRWSAGNCARDWNFPWLANQAKIKFIPLNQHGIVPPPGVIVKALDWRIIVREFKLQSCYYVHFQKKYLWERHEPPYPSVRLQPRSKRVQTPLMLLCSISDKYLWERHEPLYPPIYGLNSTTTVLLKGWIWHEITQEGWYAIK